MHDILPPIGICSGSHELFKFWKMLQYPGNSARQRYSCNGKIIRNSMWPIYQHHYQWPLVKTARFPTLNGPWPWPWIGTYCILLCITHQPLPTFQISLKSKKLFVDGQTYACTYVRTDRHLRPALLRRLCQRVNIKIAK